MVGVWFYRMYSSKGSPQTKILSIALPSQIVPPITGKPRLAPNPANLQRGANPQQSGLRPFVDVIVDSQTSIDQRLAAIDSIKGRLTNADRESLYNFLRQESAADNGQLGQVLKNRLLDVLCALNPPASGLLDLLAEIYQDQGQNTVLRDYAVQHMVAYCQQLGSDARLAQAQSEELEHAKTLLWQALTETDSSIAGTALLGLDRLSQAGEPDADHTKISAVALKLAGDTDAGELSRITAFQVCANLGLLDALPIVWDAAQNGATVPVQLSAIGALGMLGGPDQIPFLNNLIQGNNNRLKLPAQHALDQIKFRLKQQAQAKTS